MMNLGKMILSMFTMLVGCLAAWIPDKIDIFYLGLTLACFSFYVLMESLIECGKKE